MFRWYELYELTLRTLQYSVGMPPSSAEASKLTVVDLPSYAVSIEVRGACGFCLCVQVIEYIF